MKITIESTTRIINVDGTEARLWEGTSEGGVQIECLITRIAVHKDQDLTQFEAELREQRRPRFTESAFPSGSIDMRFLL